MRNRSPNEFSGRLTAYQHGKQESSRPTPWAVRQSHGPRSGPATLRDGVHGSLRRAGRAGSRGSVRASSGFFSPSGLSASASFFAPAAIHWRSIFTSSDFG